MSTECYDDEAEVSRLEKELLHLCNKVERISNNFKDLIDEEYHLKIVTDEKEKIVLPNIYIDDYDLEQPKRDYVSSMRKRTSHGSYDYVCSDDDKREKPIANRYVGPEMINTDIQYTQLFQNQLIIKYNTLMRGYIVHVDSPYSFYVRLKNSSYETDFVDDKLFSKCQQPNSSLFYNQSESICSASNIPSCSYMENTRFHTKSCDNQSFLKQIKYFYEGPDCLCRPLKNARLNQICVVRVNLQTNGIFDPDIANMEICYYRGFVTKIDKANQLYEVFLIDHGGKVTVTWQDVLEFSYHFFKQKSLIFSCFLDYDLYKHDITEYNKRLHILMLKNICIRIKFRFEYTEYNHYFQKQIPAQIRFRLNFQEGFDLLIDSFSEYFGNYFNYKCDDYQKLFADFISSNPEYSIDKDTLSNYYRAFSLKFPQYESKEFQGNLFPVKVIWKRAKRFEFACIHIDRQLDYFTSYLCDHYKNSQVTYWIRKEELRKISNDKLAVVNLQLDPTKAKITSFRCFLVDPIGSIDDVDESKLYRCFAFDFGFVMNVPLSQLYSLDDSFHLDRFPKFSICGTFMNIIFSEKHFNTIESLQLLVEVEGMNLGLHKIQLLNMMDPKLI